MADASPSNIIKVLQILLVSEVAEEFVEMR
jgi:hypothetical protein